MLPRVRFIKAGARPWEYDRMQAEHEQHTAADQRGVEAHISSISHDAVAELIHVWRVAARALSADAAEREPEPVKKRAKPDTDLQAIQALLDR